MQAVGDLEVRDGDTVQRLAVVRRDHTSCSWAATTVRGGGQNITCGFGLGGAILEDRGEGSWHAFTDRGALVTYRVLPGGGGILVQRVDAPWRCVEL